MGNCIIQTRIDEDTKQKAETRYLMSIKTTL